MTLAARRVAPSPAAQGRHTRRAAPAERVHAQPGGSNGVGGVPERSKERG
jgi:hypothetical protein